MSPHLILRDAAKTPLLRMTDRSASARAAHYRLEIVIRLDDFDQAVFCGAVAAIGVGMVLLHQRLVFRLDGFERRIGAEPHHLQRLALGVEHLRVSTLASAFGPGRQRPRPFSSLNMENGSAAPSRSASGLPLPRLALLVLAPIFQVGRWPVSASFW